MDYTSLIDEPERSNKECFLICIVSTGCHFLLSALAAWLGYWLTSTILSVISLNAGIVVSGIELLSILVALCFAVSAHILEDLYVRWF